MVRKSYTLFILSDNQQFFMANAFPLLSIIMTSIDLGAASTIFKVFGMNWSQSRDLPIQIWVCYYWAKSAGLFKC